MNLQESALHIDDFNADHETKKISKTHHLQFQYPIVRWPHQIYIYHDFEHSKYYEFVAKEPQITLDRWIKLK
jgi:hypothetical protein